MARKKNRRNAHSNAAPIIVHVDIPPPVKPLARHSIPLIKQEHATLIAPHPLTPENIEMIRGWLDLMEAARHTPEGVT